MGSPNLEVFKFGLYLFVPVFALLHFGDPQWYHDNVLPYKERLFPRVDETNRHLLTDQEAIRSELARIKAGKLARRLQREKETQEQVPPAQPSQGWFKWW
ncbi:hypothetical protein EV363DRAFT_1210969 [Boletus edulis]|uniref:Uncharacterized protein n=1 Tax=Boletus edulis BED1 TaxID=1328754 RepID=A0AAD4BA60_BOLED|nr:hypothetical protein EV363DRAFT_1210969 [Boletus edulis]KAF8415411.1 hypothetical protein L210DRAFT_3464348 [Boletus edulis BED1]KAF8448052.1 hypothetical protein L210DRAFT_3441782 [Boletus edulis BED1]